MLREGYWRQVLLEPLELVEYLVLNVEEVQWNFAERVFSDLDYNFFVELQPDVDLDQQNEF